MTPPENTPDQEQPEDRRLTAKELAAVLARARREKWTRLAIWGYEHQAGWESKRKRLMTEMGWKAHEIIWGALEPAEAKALAHLTELTTLNLWNNQLTDAGPLAGLKELTTLDLQNNRLRNAGPLAGLKELTTLDLWNNQLTDAGPLAGLKELTTLYLSDNQLTDAGPLAGLKKLTSLRLDSNLLVCTPQLLTTLEQLTKLTRLAIRRNPDLGIPDDELPQDLPAVTLDRLRAKLAGGGASRPWREVKIALLGDGEVGKSMLRWRLAPLEGEAPPRSGPEGRTRAWERRIMQFDLPQEEAPKPRGASKPKAQGVPSSASNAQDHITAHLFDFGGQQFLWGSHRLFLGVQRSIYTIVARANAPLESVGNHVMHWLRLVLHMREETIQAWVEGECEEQSRRGEIAGRDLEEFEARRTAELRADSHVMPVPPVLVVLTHADSVKKSDLDAMGLALRSNLAEFRSTFGEIPILPVEIGPENQHWDAAKKAKHHKAVTKATTEIRAAWNALLHNVPKLWNSSIGTESFLKLRGLLGDRFPDVVTENSPPPTPWITVQEYERLAKAINNDQLARALLTEFRDVGVVHWVGDAGGLVNKGEKMREFIFNPQWTAKPIYEVLWEDRDRAPRGIRRKHELLTVLRASMVAPTPPTGSVILSGFADPASALLTLMRASQLIFRQGDLDAPQTLYVVPDHLDFEPKVSVEPPFALRWKATFIADAVMPRLIGQLWEELRDGDTQNRNRMRLKFPAEEGGEEARGELVQVGYQLVLRTLSGDAGARQELMIRVKSIVGKELRGARVEKGEATRANAPNGSEAPSRELIAAATTSPSQTGVEKENAPLVDHSTTNEQMKWMRSRVRPRSGERVERSQRQIDDALFFIESLLKEFDHKCADAHEERNSCLVLAYYSKLVAFDREPRAPIILTKPAGEAARTWYRLQLTQEERRQLVGCLGKYQDAELGVERLKHHGIERLEEEAKCQWGSDLPNPEGKKKEPRWIKDAKAMLSAARKGLNEMREFYQPIRGPRKRKPRPKNSD